MAARRSGEKRFLEVASHHEFRNGGAYLPRPVMSTHFASRLRQEGPEVQGLNATAAPRLHPEVKATQHSSSLSPQAPAPISVKLGRELSRSHPVPTLTPRGIEVLLGGKCTGQHRSRDLGKPETDHREEGQHQVTVKSTPRSLRARPSHPREPRPSPTSWSPHELSLTASQPGFWQLEPVRIRLLSSPGRGKQSQEPAHSTRPRAPFLSSLCEACPTRHPLTGPGLLV